MKWLLYIILNCVTFVIMNPGGLPRTCEQCCYGGQCTVVCF